MRIAPVAVVLSIAFLSLISGCAPHYGTVAVDTANVRVVVNPYGIAPLVALMRIDPAAGITASAVHRIDVTIQGPDGRTRRWMLPYGAAEFRGCFDVSDLDVGGTGAVTVPLLGLSPDASTEVTVEVFDDRLHRRFVSRATVTTVLEADGSDPLRDGYPGITVLTPRAPSAARGMTLVSFSMGNNGRFVTRPFIMSSRGELRWVLRLDGLRNWASPVERLSNGNLVLGRGTHVYEYSMLGRQIRSWDIGRYGYTQHHDIFEITAGPHAGDLLVAVDRIGGETVEDVVIEIDRSGALIDSWDLRDLLDTTRTDILENHKDWFHMNSVVYDPRDDSVIVSGRNQGVVKIGRDHVVRWILAPHRGWGRAGAAGTGPETAGLLLTAVSPAGRPYAAEIQAGLVNVDAGRTFDWPWGEHSLQLLANGHLFMFDNGFNRLFLGRHDGFSRAVEFAINEKARTVRQVWQYGADRGSDYYSDIISDVDDIPGSNTRLITSGSIRNSSAGPHAYVTEITYPRARVLFEARMDFKDAHANLKAGGWGNIDIVYRAEKVALYPRASRCVEY